MTASRRREIVRALRFVSEHLTEPITVADVARAAGLSEFHLHRVFHAALGESVGRFITRRRLEDAALRLAYEPRVSITEIALSSGYSSSSNFSKAFSAYFGCSPSALRDPDREPPRAVGTLTARYGKRFEPEALYTLSPDPSPEALRAEVKRWNERVRFETVERLSFACLASPAGYDFASLDETWRSLIERAYQLGLADGPVDAWGIAHDSPTLTAPDLCRYHACVPCLPEGADAISLAPPLFSGERPAGRYAVFHFEGPVEDVPVAYRSIYSCWFRESSVVPVDYVSYDHYVADEPIDGRIELELWFRIQPRTA